eukprot:975999_1
MATAFDFNRWLTDNGLIDINDLFVKHKMISIETLSLQSESFQHFICDPLLIKSYSHLMQRAVSAIQDVTISAPNDTFIVISEEENAVMDCIKSNLNKLTKIRNELNDLKIKYPQSIEHIRNEKLTQIATAQNKVNQTFDNITNVLNQKKQTILIQLEDIKKNVINGQSDCQPMDALLSSLEKVDVSNTHLRQDLNECKEKIKSQTERQSRQEDVMIIGQRAKETFNETVDEINQNRERVTRVIERNNDIRTRIDFVANERVYKQIVCKISNIGVIDCNGDHMEEGEMVKNDINDQQNVAAPETESSNNHTSNANILVKHEEPWSWQNNNSNMDSSNDRGIVSDNPQSDHYTEHLDHVCKYCDAEFDSKVEYRRHIEEKHERKRLHRCHYKQCNAAFYLKTKLTSHIERIHHSEQSHTQRRSSTCRTKSKRKSTSKNEVSNSKRRSERIKKRTYSVMNNDMELKIASTCIMNNIKNNQQRMLSICIQGLCKVLQ